MKQSGRKLGQKVECVGEGGEPSFLEERLAPDSDCVSLLLSLFLHHEGHGGTLAISSDAAKSSLNDLMETQADWPLGFSSVISSFLHFY